MLRIPYGYRLENGVARVDPEEADAVRRMITLYLSGASIPAAGKSAGIELSPSALGTILGNRVYLGDAVYPPLIEEALFDRVQEERKRRVPPPGAHRAPPCIAPIESRFVFLPCSDLPEDPRLRAQEIYTCIIPLDDNKT